MLGVSLQDVQRRGSEAMKSRRMVFPKSGEGEARQFPPRAKVERSDCDDRALNEVQNIPKSCWEKMFSISEIRTY